MYEKKLLDGIGIYRTLFHRQTVCGYVRQTAVFIPYQRYIQSFRLSYNDYGKRMVSILVLLLFAALHCYIEDKFRDAPVRGMTEQIEEWANQLGLD